MSLWTDTFSQVRPQGFVSSALWWLFGNAEDGPYGIFTDGASGPDDRHRPIDWRMAAKWWLRNPFHNIFFYLIDIDFTSPRVIYGTPDKTEAPRWNEVGAWLIAINGGPYVSFRNGRIQAYAGWRPFKRADGTWHGVPGLTFRRK